MPFGQGFLLLNRLRTNGRDFLGRLHKALFAAIREMEFNVHEHSNLTETGILAFYARSAGTFEFVVADCGVGVLATLQELSDYTDLQDHGLALQEVLKPGVSRYGRAANRGNGFRDLFIGLASLNADLRFRFRRSRPDNFGTTSRVEDGAAGAETFLSGFCWCLGAMRPTTGPTHASLIMRLVRIRVTPILWNSSALMGSPSLVWLGWLCSLRLLPSVICWRLTAFRNGTGVHHGELRIGPRQRRYCVRAADHRHVQWTADIGRQGSQMLQMERPPQRPAPDSAKLEYDMGDFLTLAQIATPAFVVTGSLRVEVQGARHSCSGEFLLRDRDPLHGMHVIPAVLVG